MAAVLNKGEIIGLVLENLSSKLENFMSSAILHQVLAVWNMWILREREFLSEQIFFICEEEPELVAAAGICEDLWVTLPPSVLHAQAGANLIVNLSASNEMVGKDSYRRDLVSGQSARLVCGYANAGEGSPHRIWSLVVRI